jgi:CRP-like cAMP-binding protein
MIYQGLWGELSPDIREHFERASRIKKYKRSEIIYDVGLVPEGLYFVQEGLVGLTIIGLSGRDHLLRFFRKGQFFGHRSLFSEELYHGSTIALEPSTLVFLPKEVVLEVLRDHPELYKDFVFVLAKELRRAENQHVMVLENQVLVRVAQSLVYLKELHSEHPWTRQEIANFCASTTSTVIKACAQLEEMGLISQKGRAITILDRTGLIDLQNDEL